MIDRTTGAPLTGSELDGLLARYRSYLAVERGLVEAPPGCGQHFWHSTRHNPGSRAQASLPGRPFGGRAPLPRSVREVDGVEPDRLHVESFEPVTTVAAAKPI